MASEGGQSPRQRSMLGHRFRCWATFADPAPTYARLVGKQEGYVQTYIPVYRSEASSLSKRYAQYGCLASVGASLVFLVTMAPSPGLH